MKMEPEDEVMTATDEPRWPADVARYDSWFERPWGCYAAAVEVAAIEAGIGTARRARVLDVGCGSGRISAVGDLVIGIDRDLEMLALARRRLPGPFVCADADHLPFRDGAFDVTVAVTLCEFTADVRDTVGEMARVTRGGGRFVIGALNRRSAWGVVNRKQFDAAPWDHATFLSEATLREVGAVFGPTTCHAVLYAPDAWPGLRWWGPMAERVGGLLAPHHGAFLVARTDKAIVDGSSRDHERSERD